jgi:mannose/cellobiose epimerase-like protein (N-acyl-D-glucosamine 2-epimerase family)
MTSDGALRDLRDAMREELVMRILPFWMGAASDRRHGGVIGLIDEDGPRIRMRRRA